MYKVAHHNEWLEQIRIWIFPRNTEANLDYVTRCKDLLILTVAQVYLVGQLISHGQLQICPQSIPEDKQTSKY